MSGETIVVLLITILAACTLVWVLRVVAQQRADVSHVVAPPHPSPRPPIPARAAAPSTVAAPTTTLLVKPTPEQRPRIHSSLVERADALATQFTSLNAAIDAVSDTLDNRVTLRAERMAAEQRLAQLRARAAEAVNDDQPTLVKELDAIEGRLSRLLASAGQVRADYDRMAAQMAELPTALNEVTAALDTVTQHAARPVRWDVTAAQHSTLERDITDLLASAPPRTHDQVKRRLIALRDLQACLVALEQRAAEVADQQRAFVALLAAPELAQTAWANGIAALVQHARARGLPPAEGGSAVAALLSASEALLHRRATLLANLPPYGEAIDEHELTNSLSQVQALRHDVQALWQHGRTVAAQVNQVRVRTV